jgi:hypothetical protein
MNKYPPFWQSINKRRENAMARKQEEIQQEYGQLCAQNGERHFQIKVMQAEIEKNEQRIVELGKEMQEAVAAKTAPAEEKTDAAV